MERVRFIEVILPLRLEWNPVYSVPAEVFDTLHKGSRVRVIFAHKEYVGVVCALDAVPKVDESKILPVAGIETGLPDISEPEFKLWEFISDYYLCSVGEVYKAAYPIQKVRSEEVAVNAAERARRSREKLLQAAQKRVDTLRGRLARKEADLGRKHSEAVMARLREDKEQILAELRAAEDAARRLESVGTLKLRGAAGKQAAKAGKPKLLTSPDRRSEYLQMCRKSLDGGFSSLVLVPENDFTGIIEDRFRQEFGDRMLVFGSRKTAVQRRRTADLLREAAEPYVVVGTRSALFLPFSDLGLMIVDEEQDPLHKQTEPAPRINARDCAAMLASIHGAQFVLGSATPSLETLYNCLTGKYSQEGSPAANAPVEVIDVSEERRKRGMSGPFSYKLKDIIDNTAGGAVLVRGWENVEELDGWTGDLFADRQLTVLTPQAARKLPGRVPLIAVLQADALFPRDDFRADERALQLLRQIGERTDRLVVQTAKSAHPVFASLSSGADASSLLEERRDFNLPPFTKIVDIRIDDDSESRKELMTSRLMKALKVNSLRLTFARNAQLCARKAALRQEILAFEKENRYPYHIKIDVDP
ncbi:MAG: hypothetical protein Q4F39_07125 [Bacteroidia bacterium]|nr:hypothetical protein [Bacteroidia bacterium]